jgi:hypothetical protein
MGISQEQEQEIDFIGQSIGLVSLICSVFTLVLIYFTRKWNGYLLLLTSMTVSQVIYDINYILRPARYISACFLVQFLDLLGGLGVSFWTNILAFVIAYTIVFSQSINIFALYPYFAFFAIGIPLIVALLAMSMPDVIDHTDDGYGSCSYQESTEGSFIINFYYYGRLVSVIWTVILCSLTFYKIRQMAIGTGPMRSYPTASKDTDIIATESRAILMTVKKMNYYAVAQVICRSGAAWNEFDYGRYSSFESEVAAAICSPSTGIFNFLIFLVSIS